MARILSVNEVVNGYTIDEELNRGNIAFAYVARGADGKRVFLKMFKSPSRLVPWYAAFLRYENALRDRIETTSLKNFVCRILDFFEATVPPRHTQVCYFQTYEFVERGRDLAAFLRQLDENPHAHKWDRRLVWAKVIMGSVLQMHQNGIVHGDLKPDNLMLIADKGIKVGYRLKVIDIDFAIMTDRRTPWHGEMGYVGTPGYLSPEHLAGKVPEPASDIFTCGIILSELLGRVHPFAGLGDEEYRKKISAHTAPRLTLDGPMPGGNDSGVVDMIQRMLHPDARRRPDAAAVLSLLNSGARATDTMKPAPSIPELAKPTPAPPAAASRITLTFESFQLPFGVSTRLNRRLVQQVGNDAQYWDSDHQFTLERRDREWYAVPNPVTKNETLHNGRALAGAVLLKDGDQLGVGREAKSVIKTPARVSFS